MGIYQLLFGLMRMGFISIYLSEQLISGFTTAASVYVFTSQLTFLLGLHLPHRSGPLALVTSYLDIIRNISHVNPATVSISILACFVLALFKLYLNDKLKQWYKINIPFPIELFLVVVGTLLSYTFNLQERHNIDVVGVIPSGLPVPTCPDYKLVFFLAKKTIPLAIVAYTLTISVGKIFAVKHNYSIDPNQELIALGSLNVVSSFFSCLPSAASLSRSAVQESSGGKSQLVSLINSAGIIFVLYFAGFLLEKLPTCLLAAIISIALKSLFLQVKDFFRFWKVSKLDGSIWLITFIAVILLDVDIGLYVGLAYSLITLIYKSQRPKTYLLGSINYSDVYVPLKKYAQAMNVPGIVIYQVNHAAHLSFSFIYPSLLTPFLSPPLPPLSVFLYFFLSLSASFSFLRHSSSATMSIDCFFIISHNSTFYFWSSSAFDLSLSFPRFGFSHYASTRINSFPPAKFAIHRRPLRYDRSVSLSLPLATWIDSFTLFSSACLSLPLSVSFHSSLVILFSLTVSLTKSFASVICFFIHF